jgi:hypothetical protein
MTKSRSQELSRKAAVSGGDAANWLLPFMQNGAANPTGAETIWC